MLYLDASAIVKLVCLEPETRDLFAFLREHPERVSSVISAVEVPRAVARMARSERSLRRAERILGRLGLVELDADIRTRAASLEPTVLRSLDAIHIATALELGNDIDGMVTYDDRQAAASREAGMDVRSPGRQ